MNRVTNLCALSIYTALFALIIANAPLDLWNSARAFLAVAAFDGLSTFPGQSHGLVYGQYYPPLAWWWYSVTGVFESPTAIIVAASFLNVLGIVGAIFLAIKQSGHKNYLPAFTLTVALWLLFPTTFYIISKVHVDAPAVTLAILSTIFLQRALESTNFRHLVLAATFLAISIWVKQTLVFILPAHALFIFLRSSHMRLLNYVALCISILIIIGILVAYVYGWKNLQFHIVELPAVTPNKPLITWLSIALLEAIPLLLSLSLIVLAILKPGLRKDRFRKLAKKFAKHPIAPYCLIALFTLPISLMARVRYGGDVNSSLYLPFLLIAGGLWFSGWRSEDLTKRLMSNLTLLLLTIMAFIQVGVVYPSYVLKEPLTIAWSRVISLEQRNANPSQRAYEYALRSPNKVYFPMYPLSNWLANKTPGPWRRTRRGDLLQRRPIFLQAASLHR